jgi:hypothetical protein
MIKEQSCNGSTMLIGLGFQIGFSYVSISDWYSLIFSLL